MKQQPQVLANAQHLWHHDINHPHRRPNFVILGFLFKYKKNTGGELKLFNFV
jgi:hypothetical protein